MSDKKIQKAQENELQYLKIIFGHSNVVDLRSNVDDKVEQLKLKIVLRRHGKLDERPISIDLTVTCDADYPEGKPQYSLDNGKGISAESVETLTRTLEEYNILKLALTVQTFLNEYELPAVPSSSQYIQNDIIEECRESHNGNRVIENLDESVLKPNNSILNDNYDEVEENKMEKSSVDINTAILNGSRFENDFTQFEKLGKGAFGEVFKVQHKVDKVEYAIKKIPLEKNSRELYKFITKEVQLLSSIYHEYIVRYNTSWIEARQKSEDINKDDDTSKWSSSKYTSSQKEFENKDDEELEWDDSMERVLYIQMEYCGGKSLSEAIDNGLYNDIDRVWRYFRQICVGLAYVHKQHVIHRDLKPDNIFIDANDQIKIGDFGLATRCGRPQESLSQLNNFPENDGLSEDVGKLQFMSSKLYYQYDTKNDMYQLGIVLLELSSRPNTSKSFIINEDDLSKPQIIIPHCLLENVKNQNLVQVIEGLLQLDPPKWPTIDDLLKSQFIPPAERDIVEFQEKIRNTIDNPQTTQYKYLIEKCMAQEILDPPYKTARFPKLHDEFDKLKIIIMNLFRKHGGKDIEIPLLTACSKDDKIDKDAVRLMTKSGRTVFLPHNLRSPFVHFVGSNLVLNNTTSMRRYSISNVYRENQIFNYHPKQLCEGAFDIISKAPSQTSTSDKLSVDAELISIAYEIINEIPALQGQNISFRINHTTLLQEILKHFEISTGKFDEFYGKFQSCSDILGVSNVSNLYFKTLLYSFFKKEEIVTVLFNLLKNELPFVEQITKITTIFQNTQTNSESLVKAAIDELETVVKLAQSRGVSCAFNLALGLTANSVPTKSGRILWQMVVEPKIPILTTHIIVATGERYDSFFSESKPLGIHIENSNVVTGAGLTFSINDIVFLTKCSQLIDDLLSRTKKSAKKNYLDMK